MSNRKDQPGDAPRQAAMEALKDFEVQETERSKAAETRETKKAVRKKVWIALQCLILAGCIGILIHQMPELLSSLNTVEKPLRNGTYATDALTDQCIQNLWQISKGLQEGKMPDGRLVCPASQKPYSVIKTEDDVMVRSPNPEQYGFKDIRVSKKKPVPELIQ